jgi:UDP-N-acetylmuramoyl-tripeptide--D-alanyl-D-alanine ligase
MIAPKTARILAAALFLACVWLVPPPDAHGALAQILAAAAFIVWHSVTSLHDYHMFQLNSYKPLVHLRWLRRGFAGEYLARYCLYAAAFICLLSGGGSERAVRVCVAFCSAQAIYCWPMEKAKKPLVYTNRVKRMLVTDFVLTAAVLALSFYRGQRYEVPLLWLLGTPLVTLLSNAINAPMERLINNSYIEDARRIIKNMPRLTVIGVTGSYGKTSTKYFLHRLLSQKFNVLMTPESYNTTMGVVKTIRNELRPFHDVFICEMGARNIGDIKEICGIVSPKLGVITSIGPQHLESFGSVENIVRTKFELADSLPEDGALFANFDDERIRHEITGRSAVKTVTYGLSDGCDYTGKCVAVSSAGSEFTVLYPGGTAKSFSTKLLGRHNVTNILAALAVADYLGVESSGASVSVRRLEAVPHRLQLISRGDIIIIDDAYNSNAAGAEAALEVLSGFDGFKILVTPGMVELGGEQDALNRKFGESAARVCDFVVLVGERVTKSILAGLNGAAYPKEKVFTAKSVAEAFEKVNSIKAGKQKVVLIENDLPDNY